MSISPWALRNILDNHQRFTKAGLKVFLRIQSTADTDQDAKFQTFGYIWAPTGSQQTGFDDVLIQPPPDVMAVSQRTIGLSANKLRFGAHKFVISHTFIMARMVIRQITDPAGVFTDSQVIGLVHNSRIYSIDTWEPNYAGGGIISWDVVGNALEQTAPST